MKKRNYYLFLLALCVTATTTTACSVPEIFADKKEEIITETALEDEDVPKSGPTNPIKELPDKADEKLNKDEKDNNAENNTVTTVTDAAADTEPGFMDAVLDQISAADSEGEPAGEPAVPSHKHHFVVTDSVEADCTRGGLRVFSCECGASYTEKAPASGHKVEYQVETEATCTAEGLEKGKCSVCGEELERIIPMIDHSYELTDHQDATCDNDGYDEYKCSVCDDIKTDTIPALGHTAGEWEVKAEATHLTEGLRVMKCVTCGVTLDSEVIEKTPEHTFVETEHRDATCTTEGFTDYQCECGITRSDEIPARGHKAGGWQIEKPATYTESGEKVLRCADCGYVMEKETLPVIPHEHAYKVQSESPATCTNDGVTVKQCSICGDTVEETIEATGHNESWVTTKAATCTDSGLEELKCSVCGNVSDTKEIEAAGHSESDWITTPATCEADGERHTVCNTCGAVISTETLTAAGHSYGEEQTREEENGSITHYRACGKCGAETVDSIEKPEPPHEHAFTVRNTVPATCTSNGSTEYACECGESYTITSEKLPHTPGDWETKIPATEEAPGLKVQKCTVCGEEINSRVLSKLPHKHNYQITETVPATCDVNGKTVWTCQKCSDSYDVPIKATGHVYKVDKKAATCTEAGYVKTTCENCDYEDIKEIEMLQHHFVETGKVDATCAAAGSITYTCDICHKETKTDVIPKKEHVYKTRTVEATCTAEGYDELTCENCGEVKKENIVDARGHNGKWQTVTPAEFGKDGLKKEICESCGETLQEEKIDMLTTDGKDNIYWVDMGNGEKQMVIGHFDNYAADEIFNMTNELRRSLGLSEYLRGNLLNEAAKTRAVEIAVLFDHTRPKGGKWYDDYPQTSRTWRAENINRGYANAQAAFNGWKNSEGHYANMVNENLNCLGVAFFMEKQEDGSYLGHGVQVFAGMYF